MKSFKFILANLLFILYFPSIWAAEVVTAEANHLDKVEIVIEDPRDPFETVNRSIWYFNYELLDKHFYRHVAHMYRDNLPREVKSGVNNFLLNFEEPSSLVNNLLQGKLSWAANAGGRFIVNSSIGVLGLFDVAQSMGMPRKRDEFGEVLGYYGVPNGPYFMLPFLGPDETRGLMADWVDELYFPLSEFSFWHVALKWSLTSLHQRAASIDQERLLDNALDPYEFAKNAYLQHVNYKVYDGVIAEGESDDGLEDYLDELD